MIQQAEKLTERALEIRKRALGPLNPKTLESTAYSALNLIWEGQSPKAEGMLRDVIRKQRNVVGPEHPDTLYSMRYLSMALIQEGRLTEAEGPERQVLSIQRRTLARKTAKLLAQCTI